MRKENNFIIKLGKDDYPREVVTSTCCQFLERNYIFLENKNGNIEIKITPKNSCELKKVKSDFNEGLVSNALRYDVSQRNKDVREYIVKAALSFFLGDKTGEGLLIKDLQTQDWKEDPLGIAIPWEEKHKSQRKVKSKK